MADIIDSGIPILEQTSGSSAVAGQVDVRFGVAGQTSGSVATVNVTFAVSGAGAAVANSVGVVTSSKFAVGVMPFTASKAASPGTVNAVFVLNGVGFHPPGAVGPVSPGLDTTLVPGRTLTKERFRREIEQIRQDAMAALAAVPSRSGLSELEAAELDLFDAQKSYDAASDGLKTSYSRSLYEAAENAKDSLRSLEAKVDRLKTEEAKARAIEDARAKIRQQVKDAISKRKAALVG